MGFYTGDRLRRLRLDGIIDLLYTPEDHDLPAGMRPERLRRYPAEHYSLKSTQHRHTPKDAVKPNEEVGVRQIYG